MPIAVRDTKQPLRCVSQVAVSGRFAVFCRGASYSQEQFDVLVIGTGPGGEGAAMKCSKEGLNVAVIDDDAEPGGNCTHRGTIPSKALRHAIQLLSQGSTLR